MVHKDAAGCMGIVPGKSVCGCSGVQQVGHKDWERGGMRDWAKARGLGAAAVC